MSVQPNPQRGQVIDFPTPERQPPVTATPKQRGGKRESLPRFDIHIPTWTKYQKEGKSSHFLRIERGTKHNRQLAGLQLQQRWVWLALVLSADDDGWVRNVSAKDIAFEAGTTDIRLVRRALDAMAEVGLIVIESKAEPKPEQSHTKAEPKPEQNKSKAIRIELSRDGAKKRPTDKREKREKNIPPNPQGNEWVKAFAEFKANYPPVPRVRRLWKQAEEKFLRIPAKHKGTKPEDVLRGLELAKAEHFALKGDDWETFKGPVPFLNQAAWLPFIEADEPEGAEALSQHEMLRLEFEQGDDHDR